MLGDVLKRERRPHLSLLLEKEESHGHASLLKRERGRGLGSLLRLESRCGHDPLFEAWEYPCP